MADSERQEKTEKGSDFFGFFDASMSEWQKKWMQLSGGMMDAFKGVWGADAGQSYASQWRKMWEDAGRRCMSMSTDVSGTYRKVVEAAKLYAQMLKPLTALEFKEGSIAADSLKAFVNNWIEIQKSIFSGLFGISLPPGLAADGDFAGIFGKMVESYKDSFGGLMSFFSADAKPVMDDFLKLLDTSASVLGGNLDAGGVRAFHDSWHKAYEDMFGKFLKAPSVGPARELVEKLKQDADSFLNYAGALAEFYVNMYEPGIDALEDIGAKGADILGGGSPEEMRQFYGFLIETLEKRFFELFKSPAFGETLKTVLNASLEYRKRHFDMMEELLKETPVVTRTEADEIHEQVYRLKKRVRELERKLRDSAGTE